MTIKKHTFALLGGYTLLCFIILFIYGIFLANVSNVLVQKVVLYKVLSGFVLFIEYLPAILITAYYVGLSWGFGRIDSRLIGKFSPVLIRNFKSAFFIALGLVCLCFISQELGLPLLEKKVAKLESESKDYEWYMDLAKMYAESKEYSKARLYNENALLIDAKSEEALALQKIIEVSEVTYDMPLSAIQPVTDSYDEISSAETLYRKAKDAFEEKSYFDAHYYATLAQRVAKPSNPNLDDMVRLAAVSWNMLEDSINSIPTEQASLYARKIKGYSFLLSGDILNAYYLYLDLLAEYPTDPDVKRYFEVASDRLSREYFFIEETKNADQFEQYQKVYFSVPRSDGGKDIIFIQGISILKEGGNLVQYLRGFCQYSYNKDSQFEMSCYVPYAKMSGLPVADFSENFRLALGIKDKNAVVPLILLQAVDSKTRSVVVEPEYQFSNDVPSVQLNFLLLHMTISEFDLACKASSGPKGMNLSDLVSFIPMAANYGFSPEEYGTNYINRICYPLIIYIICILAAILAWNFKLDTNEVFKFRWIFVLPFFTFFVHLAVQFFFFALSYVFFILVNKLSLIGVGVSVVVLLTIFIITVITFLSLHGDNVIEEETE